MSEGRDLIRRLVGSAGPDAGCEGCGDVLDVYVEGELAGLASAERHPEAAAHLAACPDCREDHDALVALLTTVDGLRGT
jgi:anti-sigma factor RsiW